MSFSCPLGLLIQKTQLKDVTLGSGRLLWTFIHYFLDILYTEQISSFFAAVYTEKIQPFFNCIAASYRTMTSLVPSHTQPWKLHC